MTVVVVPIKVLSLVTGAGVMVGRCWAARVKAVLGMCGRAVVIVVAVMGPLTLVVVVSVVVLVVLAT